MTARLLLALALLGSSVQASAAEYDAWQHSGSLYILTTPEGANLPATISESGFPLLVRLNADVFDFSQAAAHGEDIRFSTGDGKPLPYQIEEWDAKPADASIWVRIPEIKGNARQEIKMYWGNRDATSESRATAVFNESNGFVSVWHLDDPVKDEVGTLPSKDVGTTTAAGIIGPARHFPGGHGIFCGDKIPNYPSAASPHTTEMWFKAEKANTTLIGWGNEGGGSGSKVRMMLSSPPHVHIDSDFADVNGESTLPMSQWIHVAHTYDGAEGRIYINGKLDGTAKPHLAIKSPSRLWLGGWYDNYDFVGDIDEVRVSRVARSAAWEKLQYENQKPLQSVVGALVQPGADFSVSVTNINLSEGQSAAVSAKAGGAQKVYWIVQRGDKETIAAVDRFHFTFDAGRVTTDESCTIRFKAICAGEIKTRDIPVAIKKVIPDPAFTLPAPAKWDGRETIEIEPRISNSQEMQAAGGGELKYDWTVSGLATIKSIASGKLRFKRALGSGQLNIRLAIGNGGVETVHDATIVVTEPKSDPWVERAPDKDEKPLENQFYARDNKNEGTLFYNGTLDRPADAVFLKVYADNQLFKNEILKLGTDKTYAFTVKLKPGLVKYKVEFGAKTGNSETFLNTVGNLVCGDAYLIDGQSNALAVDWGEGEHTDTSEWIRSFGGGDITKAWGRAVRRHGDREIGCWGMDLALHLVDSEKMPICIINGAVGGTLIEAHQRNPLNPTDPETIYGRLLKRVELARLSHGIRGIFWHQGENNQGSQGATGRYGWETYENFFVEMTAGWKQDYPNIQHYYIFQIWPNSCGMGGNGASDKLRDVQRRLPCLYSHMSIMSTLGIKPEGSCHFPPAGYAELARLICPLVQRDNYGKKFDKSITPPAVKKAYYTSDKHDAIALEFDQPIAWNETLTTQLYLDGKEGQIATGSASGNVLTIKLRSRATAKTITYLIDKKWDSKSLLTGQNGIAALTFCDVPLE